MNWILTKRISQNRNDWVWWLLKQLTILNKNNDASFTFSSHSMNADSCRVSNEYDQNLWQIRNLAQFRELELETTAM